MLEIKNTSEDREVTIVVREVRTGRDGPSKTLTNGQSASLEIDGDFQAIISTTARGEAEPMAEIPSAQVVGEEGGEEQVAGRQEEQLPEAPDDVVRREIETMVGDKINLTKGGQPELPMLNQRLKDAGFGPVNAARRDEMMPEPATT